MEYNYRDPRVASFSRWRKISKNSGKLSILRMMEYEALQAVQISGAVLDVGGGQNARYLKYLPKDIAVRSVNIDPAMAPTHLVEPGGSLPFSDAEFDHVICLNTLEHIYDAKQVLEEIYRVLKPSGTVHVMVPFMFRIHGHPDDFFRATPSWWRETFGRVGFSSLTLNPLVWGRSTTGAVVPGKSGPFKQVRLHIAALLDVFSAKIFFSGRFYDGKKGMSIVNTSPGWHMVATK